MNIIIGFDSFEYIDMYQLDITTMLLGANCSVYYVTLSMIFVTSLPLLAWTMRERPQT